MSDLDFKKQEGQDSGNFLPPLKYGMITAFIIASIISVILSILPVIQFV